MTREDALKLLVDRLEATWPGAWRAVPVSAKEHPLSGELQALTAGETSHLPFFRTDGHVAWLSLAPDSDALRSAITRLRAWLIPSFGWEDRDRPLIRPSDYSGPLAPALARLSPSGYYRWHSSHTQAQTAIPNKMRLWRRLFTARPTFACTRPLSLFELREQFRLALATGDRRLADQAIAAIDERQLDTAVNTLFMRVQMRVHFGSYREVTEEESLSELLTLRLPHKIRIAIVSAFYEVYLRPADESGQEAAGKILFLEKVYPVIGALLSMCRSEDGHAVAQTLRYYEAIKSYEQRTEDPQDLFLAAFKIGDWRVIQEAGAQLLNCVNNPDTMNTILPSALAESLKYRSNPSLALALKQTLGPAVPPQSWAEFITQLRIGNTDSAQLFLLLPEHPVLDLSRPIEVRETVGAIEELFTDPRVIDTPRTVELLGQSLPLLIENMVGDTDYPRAELGGAYLSLLQLWTQQRASNLQPADSGAAIGLASGVLRCLANTDSQIAELLWQWWQARQVRARLPFVLDALELLSCYCQDLGLAQGLWIDGVSFLKGQSVELTVSESSLWRSVGRKLGFDQAVLDEYLPPRTSETELAEDDPLKLASLRKIAIVSLHQKSAETAAEMIRERTGADVLVVSEIVAGRDTNTAHTADVVLLVWAATKHAVYRAFDDVRDKITYVQGTGASSIVLALERWVLNARISVV